MFVPWRLQNFQLFPLVEVGFGGKVAGIYQKFGSSVYIWDLMVGISLNKTSSFLSHFIQIRLVTFMTSVTKMLKTKKEATSHKYGENFDNKFCEVYVAFLDRKNISLWNTFSTEGYIHDPSYFL